MRMLLFHVRGCESHVDIRRVDLNDGTSHVWPTYREAAISRGLLADDKEWKDCMDEAMTINTNYTTILQLFAILCVWCELSAPGDFFKLYKPALLIDVRYRYPILDDDISAEHRLLHELQREFTVHNHLLSEYGILPPPGDDVPPPTRTSRTSTNAEQATDHTPAPRPPPPLTSELGRRLPEIPFEIQNTVLEYDVHDLQLRSEHMLADMRSSNPEQFRVYTLIMNDIMHGDPHRSHAHFIDAPAGTGKTFLMVALITMLRSIHMLALPTATSGIAATNFEHGRTAHGRFKLPIPVDDASMPNIPLQSKLAVAIEIAAAIIWDEGPNADVLNFLTLDRGLQAIMDRPNVFMGGKCFISAGDPRQIPPVVPHGTRGDVVHHTIFNDRALWRHFHVHHLTRNMRVLNHGASASFAEWLLEVGEGRHPKPCATITPPVPDDCIELPSSMCIDTTRDDPDLLTEHPSNASITDLLDFVFPNMDTERLRDPEYFAHRVVVAPTLEAAGRANDDMTDRLSGDVYEFFSADSVKDEAAAHKFPVEFLNGLNYITGMPPHVLRLKLGMVVMLLRNLRPPGHCNGTRYLVQSIHGFSITLMTLTGTAKGQSLLLPRIVIQPNEGGTGTHWAFTLRRVQFPIIPAFAISINKSQGQTVRTVGAFLPTPVFSHGQFYVAASRTGDEANLRFWIPDNPRYRHQDGSRAYITKNIVWQEILRAALFSDDTSSDTASTVSDSFSHPDIPMFHADSDSDIDSTDTQSTDIDWSARLFGHHDPHRTPPPSSSDADSTTSAVMHSSSPVHSRRSTSMDSASTTSTVMHSSSAVHRRRSTSMDSASTTSDVMHSTAPVHSRRGSLMETDLFDMY